MRRGLFSYDIFSDKQTPQKFNLSHIRLHNISATLSIKCLRNDSINFGIKRLGFDAECGLSINKLTLKAAANMTNMGKECYIPRLPRRHAATAQQPAGTFGTLQRMPPAAHLVPLGFTRARRVLGLSSMRLAVFGVEMQ